MDRHGSEAAPCHQTQGRFKEMEAIRSEFAEGEAVTRSTNFEGVR
jgi:hypothetical protein